MPRVGRLRCRGFLPELRTCGGARGTAVRDRRGVGCGAIQLEPGDQSSGSSRNQRRAASGSGARGGWHEPQGRQPKRNSAAPFLRRKDPRRCCVIGAGREWSIWQEPVPAKIDEEKSGNKPPRHEGKGAMLAISRFEYHFRGSVPPTTVGDLPCWAAPSGTYWRRFAHCPLAESSQPPHCSCLCRG